MKLIGKQSLQDFIGRHADTRSQIESWKAEVEEAKWSTPHEIKSKYPKASILKNQNVIFDICRNKYRLWAKVNYKNGLVLIKNIGTHKEYEKWEII
ncbi:MAG: type II toxin-antitoxin system HigB family toxin [bacterium]|nr:type II toxin-antitoxin system HigB family toxin [bacterium]